MSRKIGTGCVVAYHYTLTSPSGRVIHRTANWPFRYVHAKRPKLIEGVSTKLVGHRAGDRLRLVVPPEQAYGLRDDSALLRVPHRAKKGSPDGIVVGDRVSVRDGRDAREGVVREVTATDVVVDVAHPLAGETLIFDIEILDVRRATPNEMRTGYVDDPSGPELTFPGRPWSNEFPFDVLRDTRVLQKMGPEFVALAPHSMFPPFPWGQWLYGRVFQERCRELDGDIIELGVGSGGMSLYLARFAKKLGKHVYGYDSFEGLPPPDAVKDNDAFKEGDYRLMDDADALVAHFMATARKLGVAGTITPVKGFFRDTLRSLPRSRRFCFAHLDSDLYESVHDSLEGVYDRVVDGGVIVIDDYFHHAQGPARAVSDFFNRRGLHPVLHVSLPYSVFLFKGEVAPSLWTRSLDGRHYSFEWMRRDDLLRREIEKSLRRAKSDRAREKCAAMLDLMRGTTHKNGDIYRYFLALEDFFDSFAGPRNPPSMDGG